MNSAITFENVHAGYKSAEVLHDISFSVERGACCGIIGPNGSGKTTLLRSITGLIKPGRGRVSIFGRDSGRLGAAERSRLVGLVPQNAETAMPFTVSEVVMIGRTASLPRWGKPSKQDRLVAERSMAYTNVIDFRNKLFSELSGGERQRAVIAMVLAQEPQIMLLDEATSHLDINHRLEVMQIVDRLHSDEGKTIVMVSHDLNLAAEFCDRLVLLNQGRVVSIGSPQEVLNEKILREVYHCDIRVTRETAGGRLSIIPAPRLAGEHSGRGIRVHVIGGGGCGEELLRRLTICDYTVSCGVLNEQDSDADVAAALDIPAVLEKPFSPLSEASIRRASEHVKKADIVVVSSVPFGSGNLPNLELARTALDEGKRVLIMEGIDSRDYSPGGVAARIAGELYSNGAEEWADVTDLISLLERRENPG
jgi:iron complex transport system ATP-binding protein